MAQNQIEAIYPLSPSQQGILFDTLSTRALSASIKESSSSSPSDKYVEVSIYDLRGNVEVDLFHQAWQAVVARHPALRTGFLWKNQEAPLQFVLKQINIPLNYQDWRLFSQEEQQIRLKTYVDEVRTGHFSLVKPPLMRLALFYIEEYVYRFVWINHHILLDGWCIPIVLREVMAFYTAQCAGQKCRLPAVPSFQVYIRWLKQQDLSSAQQFWHRRLQGVTTTTPLGRYKEADEFSFSGERFGKIYMQLSSATTKRLQSLVQQNRLTLNVLMQGVWAILLSRYSHQADVLFGTTVSGRPPAIKHVEAIVGPFINTVPMRIRLQSDISLLDWLHTIQTEVLEQNKYDFGSTGQIHGWSELSGGQSLFESILVFQNYPIVTHKDVNTDRQLEIIPISWQGARTLYALMIMILPGSELTIEIVYDNFRINHPDVVQILGHWKESLTFIAENRVGSLSTLLDQIIEDEIPSYIPEPASARADYVYPRTPLERQFVQIWQETLGISPIGIYDNFFALGGHSLLATQLVAKIRQEVKVELPLHTFFALPTIAKLAEHVQQLDGNPQLIEALPAVVAAPEDRYQAFPLTDVQYAYWLGRDQTFALGGVATQTYLEIDLRDVDITRLEEAWQQLIVRHDMMRMIISPEGKQLIIESMPVYKIPILDLREMDAAAVDYKLKEVRSQLSHQVLPANQWPLFDLRATRLDTQRTRLHINIDALMTDAMSTFTLFREWWQLYQNPEITLKPLTLSFRDYLLAVQKLEKTESYQRAKEYWLNRLDRVPPAPELPLAINPETLTQPIFTNRTDKLPREQWRTLKTKATRVGLTQSTLLLAVYAKVLNQWCKTSHFTINLTLFNRWPLHPEVNEILGDFTSLTLLEVDLATAPTFVELAKQLQEQLWLDLEHRAFGGVRVLRELAQKQTGIGPVLMPVVFTSTLALEEEMPDPTTFSGEIVYTVGQTPQVWLDLVVSEQQGALIFTWNVVDALFPSGLVDDMFNAFHALLKQLAADEAIWHEPNLSLVPQHQLTERTRYNATAAPISDEMLHTLFLKQATRRASELAVITSQKTLTYQELFIRANQVGHWLRERGVKPNLLVAVIMEKGWEQVVAVLGIHLAGAAYLPIDPNLPTERQHYLLAQGEINLALTQSQLNESVIWPDEIEPLCVDNLESDATLPPLEIVQQPSDLAYVIYTSGSTGLPKGVVIDHRGAVNTVLDINRRFGVTEWDRVLALSNLNFDLSVYDIFGLLGAGGAIVIPDAEQRNDPAHWLELMTRHGVTVWNTVPALMQMLVDYCAGGLGSAGIVARTRLNVVMMSGDWIPVTLPDRIKALWEGVEVYSLGGATEASIWSIFYPIEEVDPQWPSIPYGKPLTNQTFHVLDANFNPPPLWVPGDLYIGGLGLALGYWKNEEKSNASFVTHPRTGERLYKTGDLGRYILSEEKDLGTIEFLGREDFQVKIRGHRIELGEIESTLLQHPGVKETVVDAVGDPKGNRQLVAYVVLHEEIISNGSSQLAEAYLPNQQTGLILDPIARMTFRLGQRGIRAWNSHAPSPIQLPPPVVDEARRSAYLRRQSYRKFVDKAVELAAFSRFLSCLAQLRLPNVPLPKYRYGSAGSLYPVQTYLYLKANQITALDGGFYYYNPANHQLMPLAGQHAIVESFFTGENRDIFQEAAFSLFLVGNLDAITPMYGELARDFCLLEAGYMSQLLMMEAPTHQIGLCPIGTLNADALSEMLDFTPNHILLHTLVGGRIDPVQQTQWLQEGNKSQAMTWQHYLQEYLSEKLPRYMVPTTYVALDAMPLTANGKVNRQALPAPDFAAMQTTEFVAPRTPIEQQVADIWGEVLDVTQVSINDDFFDLGGDSLLITQVLTRLRDLYPIDLALRTLFDKSTVAELASELETYMMAKDVLTTGDMLADEVSEGRVLASLPAEGVEEEEIEEW